MGTDDIARNDSSGDDHSDETDSVDYEIPDFNAVDDVEDRPPVSFWQSLFEIGGGLLLLVLVSVGVLLLYLVGGIFLGLLTRMAPAVLAVSAAVILARYLSRSR